MSDEDMEDYGFEYSDEDEPEEEEQIETENTYYGAKGAAMCSRDAHHLLLPNLGCRVVLGMQQQINALLSIKVFERQ